MYILYIFYNELLFFFYVKIAALTRHFVGRPKLSGSLKSIHLKDRLLISGGTENKLWDFQNTQTMSLQSSYYFINGEVCCSTAT